MERVLKRDGSPKAANPGRVAQGKSIRPAAQGEMALRIDSSPLMVAQRKKLQSLFGGAAQLREEPAPKPNHTGLPDNLKSGIENLSGMSMDHVKVHYNSSQPAQLNALAYAQGSDIHVAPGQEQHLPHEAWHVVQQAQGRVKPTAQMKGGVPVNDDSGLEQEADAMGAKAWGMTAQRSGKDRDWIIHGTKPIQRIKIGPNNLETTDRNNRLEVISYLRRINLGEMQDILGEMQQENNPANTEYVQICIKELSRDQALKEISNKCQEGGIWTSATIFSEKQFWYRTEPQRSGSIAVEQDKYGKVNDYCSNDEKNLSNLDSEVGTLDALEKSLAPYINQGYFSPGHRLDILITGNIGPCDGCKERLHNFWQKIKSALDRLQVNVTMEVNYQTEPCLTTRQGHETMYGYGRDGFNTSPSGIRYYTHKWE
ncbi:MAG TPA: DUF4157 domain-containing protein [Gallionella sp.]|nr:DUF4157 domain-containing protein [Gallionella sp.]